MNAQKYCLFCYASKQDRKDGNMDYTIDAETIVEAGEIAQQELDDGMYCVSIYERTPYGAPMRFLEAHIQPIRAGAAA